MSVIYALIALCFIGGVVMVAALAEARKANKGLKHSTEAKILPFRR